MNSKSIDIGVITVIPTEIKALLSTFNTNEKFKYQKQGNSNYLKIELPSRKANRKVLIVISFLNKGAGNTESAITTTRFLSDWYPKIMFLVGISAGIRGKTKIGDVIFPNKVHCLTTKVYKKGEYNLREEGYSWSDFISGLMKINQISSTEFTSVCSTELAFEISSALKSARTLDISGKDFDGNINILDGSILSDNTLIRDPSYFNGIKEKLDEKCRGADMESAGFVRACLVERSDFPWLILRGVSDFGDSDKSDVFQSLAAKSACIALRELIDKYLDIDSINENPKAQIADPSLEIDIIKQIKDGYQEERWNDVCRIAPIISRYLWLSGQYSLRIEIGDMVKDAASKIENDMLRAKYLIDDIGWTLYIEGDMQSAKTNIKDGLRIAKENKEYYLSAKAHRHLASIYRRNGMYEKASEELKYAIDDAKFISDSESRTEMEAALMFSSAKIHSLSCDDREISHSIEEAKDAAEKFSSIKDKERAVKVFVFLGDTYKRLGNITNAKNIYSEGLEMAYEIGRYDEIKSNTLALISLDCLSNDEKDLYIEKVSTFCKTQKLFSEIAFWDQDWR